MRPGSICSRRASSVDEAEAYLFQDMENKIRNTLNEIYFGKTKDIINGLRSTISAEEEKKRGELVNDLAQALKSRSQQN